MFILKTLPVFLESTSHEKLHFLPIATYENTNSGNIYRNVFIE